MLAEALDELFLIDNDDQPVARCSDDLFAQQRTAEPLDKIEAAELDLIRAVYRQVPALILGERANRNPEPTRLVSCPLGGRDTHDPQPCRHALSEPFHDEGGGRP